MLLVIDAACLEVKQQIVFRVTRVGTEPTIYHNWLVDDCCLAPSRYFSAISWREQVIFRWDDDGVHFVIEQHA